MSAIQDEAILLLVEWQKFSKEFLDQEWWAINEKQNPETYTAEGEQLRALQERTWEYLKDKEW